ncbi:uncharacterized protein HVO_B0280 (plasmid) [Haloferax volcanii DS2]|jgi:hypothetical protein|uniref:Lipoprotein n=2 Tax=Haloferax volcanii (strain ATCC 29605 / DSM 3757 / JCM 8879 / NBRC 14742 / NCIMB 2012 / VKM B-1768 / DS2) TaxID=309800 RepID=D4GPS7_HALVD|nr:uncharacterized protein HVO_B0280 [Haloferax volcanii DS2]ELY36929.1 lipoprotein [Haloferax volcanii DS2]
MRETLTRRQFGVGVAVATVALAGCTDTGGGDGPVNGTNGTDGEPAVGGTETTAETGGVGTTTEDSA